MVLALSAKSGVATGELGPAPLGWSSFQKQPAEPAATAATSRSTPPIFAGTGAIATWSKWTYAAKGLQTTLDPSTLKDGGPSLGPRWSKVFRRVTYDMHSHKVLDDVHTKGLSLDVATAAKARFRCRGSTC